MIQPHPSASLLRLARTLVVTSSKSLTQQRFIGCRRCTFATLASSSPSTTVAFSRRSRNKQHSTPQHYRDSTPSTSASPSLSTSAALQQQQDQHDDNEDDDEYAWSQRDPNHHRRHCQTCACTKSRHLQHRDDVIPTAVTVSQTMSSSLFDSPATSPSSQQPIETSPSVQQEPTELEWVEPTAYSVRRRVLPSHLISLNSPLGQERLIDALQHHTATSYIPLTMHFANQSDPAFCGITTLLVVLNAFAIDPQTRWKGGWRYFGNEESLTAKCCIPTEYIQQHGITMEEFHRLTQCQGLVCRMKRPYPLVDDEDATATSIATESAAGNPSLLSTASTQQQTQHKYSTLEDFRRDVQEFLCHKDDEASSASTSSTATSPLPGIVVVSFGRSGLQQTGEGHFSPIAAYHALTDSVLLLDVARFKYPPYWVSLQDLYAAMQLQDTVTQQPRGWFTMQYNPPSNRQTGTSDNQIPDIGEDRRPAHLVPPQQQGSWCPLQVVKVEYCQNSKMRSSDNNRNTPTAVPTRQPRLVHPPHDAK